MEHCIIMVELFVVLDCVDPAVLEGKGNWVELFLCAADQLAWREMLQDQL